MITEYKYWGRRVRRMDALRGEANATVISDQKQTKLRIYI